MIPSIPVLLLAAAAMCAGSFVAGAIHGGDKVQAKWDKVKTAQLEQDARDSESARLLSRDRQKANERIDRATTAALTAADARARSRSVAGDGLRADLAALKGGSRDPASTGCSAVYDERDRLADLLEEGGQLLRECQGIGDRFTVQVEGLQRHSAEVGSVSVK